MTKKVRKRREKKIEKREESERMHMAQDESEREGFPKR